MGTLTKQIKRYEKIVLEDEEQKKHYIIYDPIMHYMYCETCNEKIIVSMASRNVSEVRFNVSDTIYLEIDKNVEIKADFFSFECKCSKYKINAQSLKTQLDEAKKGW